MATDGIALSGIGRRTFLRAGLLAGAGVATIGAGVLAGTSPALAGTTATFQTQGGWRWCSKCQGFAYGPASASSHCSGGGQHSASSFPYYLWYSPTNSEAVGLQSGWRWCLRCQGLAYAGSGAGFCPVGGRHDHSGSFSYLMWHDVGTLFSGEQDQWRWCHKCQAVFYGPNQGSSWCAESGRHDLTGSFNYMIQYDAVIGATETAAAARSTRRPVAR